jgi:hypothetical protein
MVGRLHTPCRYICTSPERSLPVNKVTKLEIDVPKEDLKRFDPMRQKVADPLVGVTTLTT